MWLIKAFLWILKLVLRIILFPIFIVTTTLTLILNLFLNLSSIAVGLVLLLMTYGIISQLLLHHWDQAALAFGMTATAVGIFFGAGILTGALENANNYLAEFIRG